MADNLQLKTSRLTDASDGNLIDDALADIEHCLRTIFGITADTAVDRAVMSVVAAGNMTWGVVDQSSRLKLAGEPTANLHAATKLYTDTYATGIGGNYKCKVSGTYGTATVPASSSLIVPWNDVDVEDESSDQWDSAARTKIVCKSAGDYLINAKTQLYPSAAGCNWKVELLINGAGVTAAVGGYSSSRAYLIGSFALMYTLAENDYLELKVYSQSAFSIEVNNESMFSIVKVS